MLFKRNYHYINDSKRGLLGKRRAFHPAPPPYLGQKNATFLGAFPYTECLQIKIVVFDLDLLQITNFDDDLFLFCKLSCKMAERLLKVSDKERMAIIIDKFCQPYQCFESIVFLSLFCIFCSSTRAGECRMTLREAHPPVETLEVFESIVFFLAVLYILQQRV